jgi:hypothetical protein
MIAAGVTWPNSLTLNVGAQCRGKASGVEDLEEMPDEETKDG